MAGPLQMPLSLTKANLKQERSTVWLAGPGLRPLQLVILGKKVWSMSSDRNPRTTYRTVNSLATVHYRGHWPPGSLSRWISVARSRFSTWKAGTCSSRSHWDLQRASRQDVKFPDSYIRIVLKDNCCIDTWDLIREWCLLGNLCLNKVDFLISIN